MFFGSALTIGGWGVVGLDAKSYLGAVAIASFSNQDFSRSNKHDTFYILACCINWMFLHFIFMSHCCFRLFPLEIYKNVDIPLSTITFTANSHADNHFYKYIYLCQILYSMKFLIKIHVKVLTKVFYIHIWFKYETPLLFFSNKDHGLHKKILYRKK